MFLTLKMFCLMIVIIVTHLNETEIANKRVKIEIIIFSKKYMKNIYFFLNNSSMKIRKAIKSFIFKKVGRDVYFLADYDLLCANCTSNRNFGTHVDKNNCLKISKAISNQSILFSHPTGNGGWRDDYWIWRNYQNN